MWDMGAQSSILTATPPQGTGTESHTHTHTPAPLGSIRARLGKGRQGTTVLLVTVKAKVPEDGLWQADQHSTGLWSSLCSWCHPAAKLGTQEDHSITHRVRVHVLGNRHTQEVETELNCVPRDSSQGTGSAEPRPPFQRADAELCNMTSGPLLDPSRGPPDGTPTGKASIYLQPLGLAGWS